MHYFTQIDDDVYEPTERVGGAWNLEEQHVCPLLGLMAQRVERDRDARRDDGLVVARLSYDILGTLRMKPVQLRTRVLRPGRSIELVEVVASQDGRDGVALRAWLMQPQESSGVQGQGFDPMPGIDEMDDFDISGVWGGGFIASVEARRTLHGAGRAQVWARSDTRLAAGEEQSDLASFAGMFDLANGIAVRADPEKVIYPNIDLTAHLFRQPEGEWVGYDTRVSFGGEGVGLTETVLHDMHGPVGTSSQILTVRPR